MYFLTDSFLIAFFILNWVVKQCRSSAQEVFYFEGRSGYRRVLPVRSSAQRDSGRTGEKLKFITCGAGTVRMDGKVCFNIYY